MKGIRSSCFKYLQTYVISGTTEEEIPAQNLTLIYIGAGLGALVVIAVTIICVVWALKRRYALCRKMADFYTPVLYHSYSYSQHP